MKNITFNCVNSFDFPQELHTQISNILPDELKRRRVLNIIQDFTCLHFQANTKTHLVNIVILQKR